MKLQAACLITAAPFLSGCSGMVPQTPEEFTESAVVSLDTNEVKQPYSKVVSLLQSKAEKCLSTRLLSRTCTNNNCMDQTITYTPTMSKGPKKTTLFVQMLKPRSAMSIHLDRQPPGGKYLAVAEVESLGPNRTKVDIYGMKYGWHAIPNAIEHWVNRTNSGCPNLAEDDH